MNKKEIGKNILKKFAWFCLLFCTLSVAYGQEVAVRTNALYWLTTTPNFGVEMALGRKWSFEASGNYNAWTFFPDGMSLRHYLVQPEIRFWPCKSFEGHFFGMHVHYGQYNIGQVPFISGLDTYTYRGELYGGGVSYGYHFAIGRRWGLELMLGVGYSYLEYNKYVCTECAELMGRYRRHFVGPTRLGVSFIYIIH
ncbi:DUF3575 domain-containing protein [uncultured Parabacteroides sp.]|uniref:DUF3575 domain-containing protein n=1 Tax=uncultured Parabacteroides sp. TaxID=512312 RepID=UPI00262FFEE3|nr:DUF3575 domain-containing protein [uncultured Parabacteroides sp.]